MALSKEQIYKMAAGTGGGRDLYDLYQKGQVSLSEIDDALGKPGAAQAWIDSNVDQKTGLPVIKAPSLEEVAAKDAENANRSPVPTPPQGFAPGIDPSQVGFNQQENTNPATPGVNPPPAVHNQPIPDFGDEEVKKNQARIALGDVAIPGGGMQAAGTDMTGTITDPNQVQQIQSPAPVEPPTTASTPVIAGQEVSGAEQIQTPEELAAAKIEEVAEVGEAQTVEAATADASPEALAQAAKVAGAEAARVNLAKRQLRKAGLSEDEIADFGNNPEALEARLGDFTEEQLGLIGGLPEEALVSSQLASLLEGIETGEVPTWARPAVEAVEQMLAQRGMTASTVGRDALMNAIVQSAIPLAQQNAQQIQQSVMQQREFIQQSALTEAELQTRTSMQNAVANANLDLANLNNEQQASIKNAEFEQQRLLSDAAARNAAKQFNASSENQVQQFMAQLKTTVDQFNVAQANAIKQFNAVEKNKIAALNAGNEIQVEQFNSQLKAQVAQFNTQTELAVEQWNAANAQAIEQSNIQWRRQANTAETAAQNAINQQNAQNAFSLTAQAQAALWQELRDAATFTFQRHENEQDREAQLYAVAIGNEAAAADNYDHTTHLVNLAKSFFA